MSIDVLRGLVMFLVWRRAMLILLGIFLRSPDRPQTYWTFEDTP